MLFPQRQAPDPELTCFLFLPGSKWAFCRVSISGGVKSNFLFTIKGTESGSAENAHFFPQGVRSRSRCEAGKLKRRSGGAETHHLPPGLGLRRSFCSEPVQVKQVSTYREQVRGLSREQEHLQTWGSGAYSVEGAEGSRAQIQAGPLRVGWGWAEAGAGLLEGRRGESHWFCLAWLRKTFLPIEEITPLPSTAWKLLMAA